MTAAQIDVLAAIDAEIIGLECLLARDDCSAGDAACHRVDVEAWGAIRAAVAELLEASRAHHAAWIESHNPRLSIKAACAARARLDDARKRWVAALAKVTP